MGITRFLYWFPFASSFKLMCLGQEHGRCRRQCRPRHDCVHDDALVPHPRLWRALYAGEGKGDEGCQCRAGRAFMELPSDNAGQYVIMPMMIVIGIILAWYAIVYVKED